MDRTNDVLKAMNGDSAAMESLYKATYGKLRAVTVSILKNEDDAEDIIQETYIKAFTSFEQLEDAGKFDAWLCRIASNKCKDYLKKHKPVLFADMGSGDEDEDPYEWSIEDESADCNPEEVAITDDTRRQLMELVNSLPDEQRICLVYYAVEEMKISEIADLLEVSESTVKSRLKYAKDKMKAKIEDLEKKGIKLRGLSGLAVVPFVYWLFAIESKAMASSAVSFGAVAEAVSSALSANAVSAASGVVATEGAKAVVAETAKTVAVEVTKHAGAKVAVGLGAKIASMPIVAKVAAGIAAGIVAVGTAVSVPVVVYNNLQDEEKRKETENGDKFSTEYSEDVVNFEETVIWDDDNFKVEVTDISIDKNNNCVLTTEVTNKMDELYAFMLSDCTVDGVKLSSFDRFQMYCEVEPDSTYEQVITLKNTDLGKFMKKMTEITLEFCVEDLDGNEILQDCVAKPVYPFGKNAAEKFKMNTDDAVVCLDENFSAYIFFTHFPKEEADDFYITFFLENYSDSVMYFETLNHEINGIQVEQLNRNSGISVSNKRNLIYSLIIPGKELVRNDISYVEEISFELRISSRNDDICFYDDIITLSYVIEVEVDESEESEDFEQHNDKIESDSMPNTSTVNEKTEIVKQEAVKEETVKQEVQKANSVTCDFCDETREGETRMVDGEKMSMCYVCKEEFAEMFVE